MMFGGEWYCEPHGSCLCECDVDTTDDQTQVDLGLTDQEKM